MAQYEVIDGCAYEVKDLGNGIIAREYVSTELVYKLTSDKPSITANGVDTATLTATICDYLGVKQPLNLTATFSHNGIEVQASVVNGEASVPFTSAEVGVFEFLIISPTVGGATLKVRAV